MISPSHIYIYIYISHQNYVSPFDRLIFPSQNPMFDFPVYISMFINVYVNRMIPVPDVIQSRFKST